MPITEEQRLKMAEMLGITPTLSTPERRVAVNLDTTAPPEITVTPEARERFFQTAASLPPDQMRTSLDLTNQERVSDMNAGQALRRGEAKIRALGMEEEYNETLKTGYEGQGMIGASFDFLNMGVSVPAMASLEYLRSGNSDRAFEQAAKELQRALPLMGMPEGARGWESSWTDVIRELGKGVPEGMYTPNPFSFWPGSQQPETFNLWGDDGVGRYTSATAGFAMDVLADPMTWLPMGALSSVPKAALKGARKVGMEALPPALRASTALFGERAASAIRIAAADSPILQGIVNSLDVIQRLFVTKPDLKRLGKGLEAGRIKFEGLVDEGARSVLEYNEGVAKSQAMLFQGMRDAKALSLELAAGLNENELYLLGSYLRQPKILQAELEKAAAARIPGITTENIPTLMTRAAEMGKELDVLFRRSVDSGFLDENQAVYNYVFGVSGRTSRSKRRGARILEERGIPNVPLQDEQQLLMRVTGDPNWTMPKKFDTLEEAIDAGYPHELNAALMFSSRSFSQVKAEVTRGLIRTTLDNPAISRKIIEPLSRDALAAFRQRGWDEFTVKWEDEPISYLLPKEITRDLNELRRTFSPPPKQGVWKEIEPLIQAIDFFSNTWKGWAVTSPGFHMRNNWGADINNWIGRVGVPESGHTYITTENIPNVIRLTARRIAGKEDPRVAGYLTLRLAMMKLQLGNSLQNAGPGLKRQLLEMFRVKNLDELDSIHLPAIKGVTGEDLTPQGLYKEMEDIGALHRGWLGGQDVDDIERQFLAEFQTSVPSLAKKTGIEVDFRLGKQRGDFGLTVTERGARLGSAEVRMGNIHTINAATPEQAGVIASEAVRKGATGITEGAGGLGPDELSALGFKLIDTPDVPKRVPKTALERQVPEQRSLGKIQKLVADAKQSLQRAGGKTGSQQTAEQYLASAHMSLKRLEQAVESVPELSDDLARDLRNLQDLVAEGGSALEIREFGSLLFKEIDRQATAVRVQMENVSRSVKQVPGDLPPIGPKGKPWWVVDDGGMRPLTRAIGETTTGTDWLSKVGKVFGPDNGVIEANRMIGEFVEDNVRGSMYLDRRIKGYSPMEARADVIKYHFDYTDLTATEKAVFKRVFPFYCVPDTYEILTKDGWKKVDDLVPGETEVVVYDHEKGGTTWDVLDDVATFDYNGQMMKLGGQRRTWLCTPDHGWPVVNGEGRRCLKKAWQLKSNDSIPTVADSHDFTGAEITDQRIAALAGWLLTDGYMRKRGSHVEMIIYQSPSKFLDEITKLAGGDGIPRKPHPDTGVVAVAVTGETRRRIQELMPSKEDGCEFASRLDRPCAEAMWDAMYKADGTVGARNADFFAALNDDVFDTFQMLTLFLGDVCQKTKRGGYVSRKHKALKIAGAIDTAWYKGRIWCPQLKNRCWYMRNEKGQVILSQNTWMRKNTVLQFQSMIENPGRYSRFPKVANLLQSLSPEWEDLPRPDYYDELFVVRTPFAVGGEPLMLNPNIPPQDINRLNWRDVLSSLNPILKVPMEQQLGVEGRGYSIFLDRPLAKYPGEEAEYLPGVSRKTETATEGLIPLWGKISRMIKAGERGELPGQLLTEVGGIKLFHYDKKRVERGEMYRKLKKLKEFQTRMRDAKRRDRARLEKTNERKYAE